MGGRLFEPPRFFDIHISAIDCLIDQVSNLLLGILFKTEDIFQQKENIFQ